MGKSYLPKDVPTVRAHVQEAIRDSQTAAVRSGGLGRLRARTVGHDVFTADWATVPEGMRTWLDHDYPAITQTSLKGYITIAEEEIARVTLRIGGARDMAGFRGLLVHDDTGRHYIQVNQLAMDLDDMLAVRGRVDRQIATLRTTRETLDFLIEIKERHPEVRTCGESLAAEGIQYEMVFDEEAV
jgi:hypothetical protein